jgi:predicted RNA binding protein YcfA (HicA-like mRNA interferase family)
MTRLPQVSGKQLVRALEKLGYTAVRQRGSHVRLIGAGHDPISVPLHSVIGKGLLRKILRDAELTDDALRKLLKK